jgi:ABC-type antimicrobial peptide transport system permease subunit
MFLHPMEKWRLYSRFDNGQLAGGRIEVVRLLGLIAGLILLIACINFMNLSTARSERRAKEVGIRKVVGVHKRLLVAQFLGESVFLAFLAALIAVALVHLSLPAFNELTEKRLFMDYSNPWFWISALSFILLTGVVAGTYPAFYLSSFQPIKVLKGTFAPVKGAITPRKVLVVLQFTIAITLIVSTLIVRRQIQYAQDRENGYSKDNLMYHMFTGEVDKNYALIRNELLQSGMALSVNKTSAPVTENWSNSWGFEWAGKDPNNRMVFNRYCADGHLASTMGFQFIKGRDMDPEKYKSDSMACVLNEAAVKAMGFKDPIGQVIKDGDSKFTVVGVVKNFILSSPFQPIEPMIIQGSSGWFNVVNIKLDGRQPTAKALARVEGIFKKYNPEYPFEYKFVDEEYARKFNDERRTQSLATVFAALAIFISCLGLFGLAAYTAESRTKEIGVRKVLGASVSSITALLSRDFLKLVLISIILAIPLAWWGMTKWLENFEYRAPMSWWIFILSGVLALLIAFATVSVQAVKAALSNPVRNLRSE